VGARGARRAADPRGLLDLAWRHVRPHRRGAGPGLSAIGALLAIPAYPFWSLTIFALDVLVIYGLVAYGGDRRIAA
jgi:hypothetical protein